MRGILSLAACELRRALGSWLAWVLSAFVVMLAALLFCIQLLKSQQMGADQSISYVLLRGLYNYMALLLTLVAPMLTMHLLSDEQRSGALELLNSTPLSCTQIMLGKFLGGLVLLLVPVLLLSLMPLSLLPFVALDLRVVAVYTGSILLYVGALTALGLYASSLGERPAVAAILSLFMIFLLWLCGLSRYFMAPDEPLTQVLSYLYLLGHYHELLTGWVSLTDVCYYLLLIGLCMGLTTQRLESRRRLP